MNSLNPTSTYTRFYDEHGVVGHNIVSLDATAVVNEVLEDGGLKNWTVDQLNELAYALDKGGSTKGVEPGEPASYSISRKIASIGNLDPNNPEDAKQIATIQKQLSEANNRDNFILRSEEHNLNEPILTASPGDINKEWFNSPGDSNVFAFNPDIEIPTTVDEIIENTPESNFNPPRNSSSTESEIKEEIPKVVPDDHSYASLLRLIGKENKIPNINELNRKLVREQPQQLLVVRPDEIQVTGEAQGKIDNLSNSHKTLTGLVSYIDQKKLIDGSLNDARLLGTGSNHGSTRLFLVNSETGKIQTDENGKAIVSDSVTVGDDFRKLAEDNPELRAVKISRGTAKRQNKLSPDLGFAKDRYTFENHNLNQDLGRQELIEDKDELMLFVKNNNSEFIEDSSDDKIGVKPANSEIYKALIR
ncbi:MAG: hypothetical protein HRT47_03355 [Candidatus Caenarcaniphilales bacterium]|nr:hypothetical protein [Candidatus Caenarcaniphilales bacterium]